MGSRPRIFLAVAGLLMALGCSLLPTPGAPTLTPFVPGSTSPAPTGVSPTAPLPTQVPTSVPTVPVVPTVPPTPVCAGDLAAVAVAGLPADTYNDVGVLPLVVLPGWDPLWAVFSVGMRPFDPLRSHFLAIYTCDVGTWGELARINLDDINPPDMDLAAPDFVSEGSVTQVTIDPARIWLTVDGGVGAHGGTFQLLSFDAGLALRGHVSGVGASPGVGSMQDVNGDGVLDAVLDQSDAYVFCYACGVRKVTFRVFYWDSVNQRILEGRIDYFYMGQPQPMRDVVNPAVDMANAGLWKDALVKITEARDLAPSYPECNVQSLNWTHGMIKLHADAMAADATSGIYPLLSRVFYGDYAAAVDLMRPYAPAQVFDPTGPLIAGTVAEGMEGILSDQIIQSADAALALKPDLAEAYLMRGWARYLVDPASPQVRTDVHQAAALRPGDVFFADCAALFP
ncbi:MAG: DUF333 domain-containing protein [Anaerolineae bacterium]|nr:DUF333 domain-containing protein [Anaerolineae bacterium]